MTTTKTRKVTLKLNDWELLAIETALSEYKGRMDETSRTALIEKIARA